ncbi:MAG TPA: MBL fold metallo-hydrolase [Bacilli bacterium]
MATLYALNVGRGDSFFVEIPTEKKSYVILLDGGNVFFDESVTPLGFMRKKGWSCVDLLILTHIHPDHLIGLLDVAKHATVKEAVLPYPIFSLHLGAMHRPKALQTAEMLQKYEQLWSDLQEQNTRIFVRSPFGAKSVWRFGELLLRHLDPVDKNHLSAYKIVERLSASTAEEQEHLCEIFDAQSNGDSSVWLLEHQNGAHLFLFGADALLPNWERITKREQLHPHGFKVPHHGVTDAWNEHLLQLLSPDWLLITNDANEYEIYHEKWEQLAKSSGSRLFVTGSQSDTQHYLSRLPQLPERIEIK